MSAHRRRRKQSGGSDDLSDSFDELNAAKENPSSELTDDHHDSEYDTAGSESDVESQDRAQRESGDGQEEEKPQKKLDDDEDRRNPQYIPKRGTFYEHDDRTADEPVEETAEVQVEREVKDKKVWKDNKEDKWNHDRYNDEEQAPKSHAELIAVYGYDIRNEEGPPRARRRRRYGRGPNKYTRNWEDEDAYGKVSGNVPTHKPSYRKSNRSGEDFPSLNPMDKDETAKEEEQPVITSAWYSSKNKPHANKNQNFPALHQTESQKTKTKQFTNSQANENKAPNERNNTVWKKEFKYTPNTQNANETSAASSDAEKIIIVKQTPREITKKPAQVQESVSLAASKSRGRGFKPNANNNIVGSRVIESKPKGRGPGPITIDNRRSNTEHESVLNDVKHMNVSTEGPSYHHAARQNKHFYTQPSSQQQHSTVVPPRMQASHPPPVPPQQAPPPPQQQQQQQQQQQPPQQPSPQQQQDLATNRPKRYSSLRQRPPIAEGPPNPPPQQNYQPPHTAPPPQHTYYPPPQAGNSRAVLESQGYPPPPGPYEPPPPGAGGPPPPPLAGQPVIPMVPPAGQPTSYAPPPPPPFLVPPPQFLASQQAPPGIINYVTGPNGPIFQPNYQGYNPAAVPPGPPPPQDVGLYQPQGCTYYSPAQQQQQQQQQPVPVRRPKAAIPILPPPEAPQQNPASRPRVGRSVPHTAQTPEQQQHEAQQMAQQQQQQEQLVQQQLKQHQLQLIQEQQQEMLLQQKQKEQQLREQQMKEMQLKEQQIQAEQQQKEQCRKEQQLKEQQLKEHQLKEQEQKEQQFKEQQQKEKELKEQEQKEQQQKEQQLKEQEQKEQQKEQQLIEQQEKEQELKEKQMKEQVLKEQQLKEKELKEQQLKEQELKEKQLKEQELKEQQLKEQELKEQQSKEQKLKEQQLKEQELKEQQLKEQKLKEQQLKEQELKDQLLKEQEQKEREQKEQEKVDETRIQVASQLNEKKLVVEDVSNLCTKPSLEQKLENLNIMEKSIISIEEKITTPVVAETEMEKKDVATKVEVIIPGVVASTEEKTAMQVMESSNVEDKTEISKCVIEDKLSEITANSTELVSEKSDADCNIKESAVIEEAAA